MSRDSPLIARAAKRTNATEKRLVADFATAGDEAGAAATG
jgi:hypothetical protein